MLHVRRQKSHSVLNFDIIQVHKKLRRTVLIIVPKKQLNKLNIEIKMFTFPPQFIVESKKNNHVENIITHNYIQNFKELTIKLNSL